MCLRPVLPRLRHVDTLGGERESAMAVISLVIPATCAVIGAG
jgi:hypothetical protein